jgi:beta-galactosidase GanA
VEGLIKLAREENLKLIFLWFGLWKNAESFYVPAWVKKDTETYFRAEKVTGEKLNTVSPLCKAAVEKDRLAFTALMRFIREMDQEENTVITIQVENEIGLLGTDRDYSPAAQDAFFAPIPEKLSDALGKCGTWQEVFGEDAGEYFMAWQFGSAVESIAASGKAEYDLPCYANCWLRQSPWYPGSYPSGGPVSRVQPIWRVAAPSLFAFGPDVYVPFCPDVMDEYATEENPLFIPEIRKDAVAASYALYAFGAKNALCFSPFGIEDLALDPADLDKPPMELMIALNIDPSAFDITGSRDCLAATYDLLAQLEPLYLKYRGTEHLQACVRHGEHDFSAFLRFQNYNLSVSYGPRMTAKPMGAAYVIELEENKFLLVGLNCTLNFQVKPGVNKKVEMLRFEEGTLRNGQWRPGRVLNGDEKMMVRFGDMPTAMMVELYQY